MASTKQNPSQPSHGPESSQSEPYSLDFSFQTSEYDRSPDNELDPDIKDAIYARMYFTSSTPDKSKDNSSHPTQQSVLSEERNRNTSESQWNISLSLKPVSSPSSRTSKETKVDVKGAESESSSRSTSSLKRKRKGARTKNQGRLAKRIHLVDSDINSNTFNADLNASDTDTGSVICIDSNTDSESTHARQSVTLKRLDKPGTRRSKKGSSSPEEDIKLLFVEGEKAVRQRRGRSNSRSSSNSNANVIVIGDTDESIPSSGEEGVIRILSDEESSLESGELQGSGKISRTNSSDMEISSLAGDEDDVWKINTKDIMGRDAYERLHESESSGRYYGKRNTKCSNCKQRGHGGKVCPWPKRHTVCYLCAGLNHVSSSCPVNICTYCYQKKHRGSSCRVPWASLSTMCNRCYMKGHHASICPDLWRQYHHTTYESSRLQTIPGSQQRRTDKVYCCNCSQKGHFGFECTRSCPRGNPSFHLPLIARYDHNIWPPRDHQSLRIIRDTLASRVCQMEKSSDVHEHGAGGIKRTLSNLEEEEEEGECCVVDETEMIPPKRKKKRKRSKKGQGESSYPPNDVLSDSDTLDHGSGKGGKRKSLVITVDNHGSRRPNALFDNVPQSSTNTPHHGMSRIPLLPNPSPSSDRDFPRTPHDHSYHPDKRHWSDDPHSSTRYNHYHQRRESDPSSSSRQVSYGHTEPEPWHVNSSILPRPPQFRDQRYLGTPLSSRYGPKNHRRFSEHLERYEPQTQYHHHRHHEGSLSQGATPMSHPRTPLIHHDRGFQSSEMSGPHMERTSHHHSDDRRTYNFNRSYSHGNY